MEALLNPKRETVRWWVGRFDLLERLEQPSCSIDRTIRRLPPRTLRQHVDLGRYVARLNVPSTDLLGYEARAEGPYGRVRLAAFFPESPFDGGDPDVFALDGKRRSLHRNPPFDEGKEQHSAHLCLYFPEDPSERRWTADFGLIELFDLGRRHLAAEHVWRETDVWPTEDAPHGHQARPAEPRPELRVAPLRHPLSE